MTATVVDRLRLSPARIEGMAAGLRTVAGAADPVGEVLDGWTRPNGLRISRVRVPLGRRGDHLREPPQRHQRRRRAVPEGGQRRVPAGLVRRDRSRTSPSPRCSREAVAKAGLPEDAVVLVEDTRHEAAVEFMRLRDSIDCLIPRGGPSLIRAVLDNATVPYVIDGDGNCHVYVDASADLAMALDIVVNAKTQRPSVCNAMETLLVHRTVAEHVLLPPLAAALDGVELVGDDACPGGRRRWARPPTTTTRRSSST